eukprot:TRINITY_DN9597_c0_g1_i2.p2 TRINITY_DN9597_c0_g1~~TRINITY_DN9597_c0_g1_i2.p2  ORF type:complete len:258 (-),score=45.79 TRINITY_DN9597_c0_g1_i2:120-893(-)
MINRQPYTEKVDTYAYGVTCWELLVRKTFFYELSFSSDVAEYVTSGERPQIPSELCPVIYRKIIEQCWAQNPDHRPNMILVLQLITELASDVEQYQGASRAYDKELQKQFQESKKQAEKDKNPITTEAIRNNVSLLFDSHGRILDPVGVDLGMLKKGTEELVPDFKRRKNSHSSDDMSDEIEPWHSFNNHNHDSVNPINVNPETSNCRVNVSHTPRELNLVVQSTVETEAYDLGSKKKKINSKKRRMLNLWICLPKL